MLGVESGGRLSEEAMEFIASLATARAQTAPAYLRKAAAMAFEKRWVRLIACSAAFAITASVLYSKAELRSAEAPGSASEPWLADVLADARRDIEMT